MTESHTESRRLTLYFAPAASFDAHVYRVLRKILKQQARAVVRCIDWAHTDHLTKTLWTAGGNSFIPHGNSEDGFADKQPIWLTDSNDNPNKASFLITFEDALIASPKDMPDHQHCLCFANDNASASTNANASASESESDSQRLDSHSQLWQTSHMYTSVAAYRHQQGEWHSCDKPQLS
ncbi:MAG: DNA polymerase III subunit chi [Alphaproteobacteria bacterium GM202ARS2]|nr:DNA polymerase III subunit chi [Alphaproteobacteria bacterium GM202ARS2]